MLRLVFRLFLFVFAAGMLSGQSALAGKSNTFLESSEDNLGTVSATQNRAILAETTESYPVTPGDQYVLAFIAATGKVTTTSSVEVDYTLNLEIFGKLNTYGFTLHRLRAEVEKIVTNAYPGSFPHLKLVQPGHFRVIVIGEVTSTYEPSVWGLDRLSSVIWDHTTQYSSSRDIEIRDRRGTTRKYDLFKAARFGDLSQDPLLRPGDVITVSKALRRVTVNGQVRRPGRYQLLAGESLGELIDVYANGFTPLADLERVEISRTSGVNTIAEVLKLNNADMSQIHLFDLDEVFVGNKLDRLPVVYIEGAIDPEEESTPVAGQVISTTPEPPPPQKIRYRLKDGDTLYSVMMAVKQRIAPDADLTKAIIMSPDSAIQMAINIESLLYAGNRSLDLELRPGQRIVIPYGNFEAFITGEVIYSKWVAIHSLARLSELIAEFVTPYSSIRDIEILSQNGEQNFYDLFRAQRFGEKDQDPYLKLGDRIVVGRLERSITITGEVERPGTYQLLRGEGLLDLIEYYGNGLTKLGDPSSIQINRIDSDDSRVAETLNVDLADSRSGIPRELRDLDRVVVLTKLELLPVVYFEGALNPPQRIRYRLKEGDSLFSVANEMSNRIASNADLSQTIITSPDSSEQTIINLEELLYSGDRSQDIILEPKQRIIIPFGNFEVFLTGEVTNSKWVNTGTLARLSALISGSTTRFSSQRNIEVLSRNGERNFYDLFKAARFGEKDQDPYLQPGDTVTVSRVDRKVTISGEVERPGTYQILKGEGLQELIEYYGGGLTKFSDLSAIEISRYDTSDGQIAQTLLIDISEALFTLRVSLRDLDQIKIPTKLNLLPVVYIEGAVAPNEKIRHRLKDGDTLLSVITSIKSQIAPNADLTQTIITKPEASNQIEINLERLLYSGDRSTDLVLEPNMRIVIPYGNFEVFLTGEVVNSQ